jgi:two-component system, OmpR family, KDP operon response regulator KdpE
MSPIDDADRPRGDGEAVRRHDGRRLATPPMPQRPVPGRGELVLIVEDELEFRDLLELWVIRHGWRTAVAGDGEEAVRRFEEEEPDLVLLDLNLPGPNGWQVAEWIRSVSTAPIIMVTALGSEGDIVRGLVVGADDYLTKPVRFPELIARIQAALRRVHLHEPPSEETVIALPGLRLELRTHRVIGEVREVHLTPTEFRLLEAMARHPGEVLAHADLLHKVWGPTYGEETQLLRVTMRNLRSKLAAAAPGRAFIETEYGLGYRFVNGS